LFSLFLLYYSFNLLFNLWTVQYFWHFIHYFYWIILCTIFCQLFWFKYNYLKRLLLKAFLFWNINKVLFLLKF
jgi:hypothetical protein